MKQVYLYPITGRNIHSQTNPYLDDFMNSVSNGFRFVNRSQPSKSGLFDILKYLGRTEIVIFHWPENMVEKNFGLFQGIFFFLLIPYLKLRKTKIIYVVHNKISHSNNHYLLKELIAKTLIRFGDLMITHSKDGVDFINSLGKGEENVFYFPHPLKDERPFPKVNKDIDILIWGNIAPYKGIHVFLEKLKGSELLKGLRIVIAGRVSSAEYLEELKKLKSPNVEMIYDYLDDEKLKLIISRSRMVLFPYSPESVLSSGAFAKSVVYPLEIIGPDCGSFSDFSYLDHVNTFTDPDEMIRSVEAGIVNSNSNKYQATDSIIDNYSWENFGKKLMAITGRHDLKAALQTDY